MWHSIEKMLEEILHASDTREHASCSEILKTHFKNVILILLNYNFRKKILNSIPLSKKLSCRKGEEAQLKWRGVKFPEYRNSISFHLKRAALISICGLGGDKYVSQSQTTNIRLVEYEDVTIYYLIHSDS